VVVDVLAGDETGARRAAHRILYIALLEQHALCRQAVNGRRLHVRIAIAAERVIALLVCADEEDVRRG
jgi:hypothetical protein